MDPLILRSFNVSKGEILCATPYHKQMYVTAGTSTGTVMLFPNQSNLRYRRLVGHRGAVTCLSASKSPLCLATGSEDTTVRLWRIQGADETCLTIEPNAGAIKSVALSTTADRLLVAGKTQSASLWDPFDQSVIQTFGKHETVNSVAINTDKSYAVTACGDGTVRIFDIRSGDLARKIDTFSSISSISLASDGNKLTVGTISGNVLLCDLGLGHISMSSKLHNAEVRSVSINPAGTMVLSGGDDNNVVISNGDTLEPLWTLPAHNDRVVDVRFSSDGETFTTCSNDHRIIFWSSPDPSAPVEPEEEDVVEEEDEIPEQKQPPMPEPEIPSEDVVKSEDDNLSRYMQSPSPVKRMVSSGDGYSSRRQYTSSSQFAGVQESTPALSEASESEESIPSKRSKSKMIVSSIQGPPSPRKGDDAEFFRLMEQASIQISQIGKTLFEMGKHMQRADERIAQLEAAHVSRAPSGRTSRSAQSRTFK